MAEKVITIPESLPLHVVADNDLGIPSPPEIEQSSIEKYKPGSPCPAKMIKFV